MKKIISVLLIIVLTFAFVLSASAADIKFKVNVSCDLAAVSPGEQFTVSFLVTDITESSGIVGLDMYIEYDSSKLEAVSKENVFPKQWDKPADFSPEFASGLLEMHLLYDGDSISSDIAVFKDNELGVKVTFKAKEGASGQTTVKLRGGNELSAAANSLETIFGEANLLTISIGTSTATTAATTEKNSDTTAETAASGSETTMTDGSDTETTDTITVSDPSDSTGADTTEETSDATEDTAASTDTTVEQGEANTTDASGDVSETDDQTDASEPDTDTTAAESNGIKPLAVIGIIALVVIAAVAAFAILKYKKGQKDDNPVNPG